MEKSTGEMMANSSMITNGGGGESSGQKYKGVRKRKWGKWVSEVRLPNSRERIWLGSYDTAEKAARAFDAAQFCLRGRHAHFNFPDSPPDIPGGRSLSPQEIQAVAARFAEEHEQENIIQLHDNNNHHYNNCDNILTDPEYFSSSTSQEVIPNPNFMSSSGDTIGHEMSNGSINTDWSFLNFLDYDGAAANNTDYDHHFDDNQYNLFSGQLYEINSGAFSTAEVPVLPQAPSATDDSFFSTRGDDDDQNINVVNGDDLIFSHNSSSFLWNF